MSSNRTEDTLDAIAEALCRMARELNALATEAELLRDDAAARVRADDRQLHLERVA